MSAALETIPDLAPQVGFSEEEIGFFFRSAPHQHELVPKGIADGSGSMEGEWEIKDCRCGAFSIGRPSKEGQVVPFRPRGETE